MAQLNVNFTVRTRFDILHMGAAKAAGGPSLASNEMGRIDTRSFSLWRPLSNANLNGCPKRPLFSAEIVGPRPQASNVIVSEPTNTDRRLAALMGLFRFLGVAQRALFLVLWDAKTQILTTAEIESRWQNALSGGNHANGRRWKIYDLQRSLERKGWPVRIIFQRGKGYTLLVDELDWTWETGSCPLMLDQARSLSRSAGEAQFRRDGVPALLEYMSSKMGAICTHSELYSVMREANGDSLGTVSRNMRNLRNIIRKHNLPFELKCKTAVGYYLVECPASNTTTLPSNIGRIVSALRDDGRQSNPRREDFARRPSDLKPALSELLSDDCVAEISQSLSEHSTPFDARALLVLWLMGGRTVSIEMMDRLIAEMMLGDRLPTSVRKGLRFARISAKNAGWPVRFHTKVSTGYKLELLDPTWRWEGRRESIYGALVPTAPGEAAKWEDADRIGLLADLFPAANHSSLELLLILLDNRTRFLDAYQITTAFRERFGVEISAEQFDSRLSPTRNAIKRSGYPMRITSFRKVGYRLEMESLPADLRPLFLSRGDDNSTYGTRSEHSSTQFSSRLPAYVTPRRWLPEK